MTVLIACGLPWANIMGGQHKIYLRNLGLGGKAVSVAIQIFAMTIISCLRFASFVVFFFKITKYTFVSPHAYLSLNTIMNSDFKK